MAVEAREMSSLPPQLTPDRSLLNPNQVSMNLHKAQMDLGFDYNGLMPDSALPFYESPVCYPVSGKATMNGAESGVTYTVPAPGKRPGDPANETQAAFNVSQKRKTSSGLSSFLDQDIIFQIQQQQCEIHRFIADHRKKVLMVVEEQRRRQSRMLIQSIQQRVEKRMREKEEEIERMQKLNWVLQERVRTLYMENQIWRDLAQSNEATANSLRNNLEQVLAHISEDRQPHASCPATADDAVSSCGSSNGGEAEEVEVVGSGGNDEVGEPKGTLCRKCGQKESSVLLLPCRHLCLCTSCGSSLTGTCPVCDSVMNASLHVNMS